MADKEILRVEIDDSEFSEFKKKFDEHESAVKTMPAQWQKAGTEIVGQKTNFEKMLKSVDEQNRSIAGTLVSQEKLNGLLDAAGLTWISLSKSGKLFSGHIVHATQSLMHWTKLTAVFSGILGAGGLFGINRMAASVAGQRTSATGLGISYGEQASFLTNFGRLGNAEGILQGFSEAETNVSKKYALRQYLGHTESGDPAKDFAEGLGRFKEFVDKYKNQNELLGPMLQAHGYDKLGLGMEQARIVQQMSTAEVAQISRGYRGDVAGRLGLSNADAKKWTEFSNQMERAGREIETVFARGTVKLTKPLERLSESFIHLTENLLKDGSPIAGWIKKLGNGIKTFADDLGSGAVQEKAAEIGRNIADTIKLFDAIVAKAPEKLAVLAGVGVAARFGGAAVATGTAIARSGLGSALSSAAGVVLGPAGALAAGGLAASSSPTNEDVTEVERQRRFHQGRFAPEHMKQRPLFGHPHPKGAKGALRYFREGGEGPFPASSHGLNVPMSGGPGIDPSPHSKVSYPAAGGTGGPAQAVNIAMSKVGETINSTDIQTYLRTGGHPDPGKQAWCAMFVGASLTKAGIKDSGSGVATSYENWGSAVNPRNGVRKGDVYVRTKGHRPGETGGHVGMLTGESRFVHGREQVQMISGNSGRGHMVRTTWEPVGGTNMIRRAPEQRKFGHPHIGHHPATLGQAQNPVTVNDHTGGLVSVA